MALPAFALSLAGCGLENIPVLSQPGSPLASGTSFQFRKIAANGNPVDVEEQGFRGYDLYYRIYDINASLDVNILTIEELQLTFRRLTSYNSSQGTVLSSPLVEIDPTDFTNEFTIVVDFSGDLNDASRPSIYSVSVTPPPPPPPPAVPISIPDFRRGVTYSGLSETKRFDDFASMDADIFYNPLIWTDIDNGNLVIIALYVVSFGVDPLYGALYSLPLYLGNIQIILPDPNL